MATRRVAPDEYSKTAWADGAEGGTAITAARLNNIENAIEDVTNYAIDDDEDLGDAEQAIADNAAAIAELNRRLGSAMTVATASYGSKVTVGANAYTSIDITLCEDTAALTYKVTGISGIRPNAANKGALVCTEWYTHTASATHGTKTLITLVIRNLTNADIQTASPPQVLYRAYTIRK